MAIRSPGTDLLTCAELANFLDTRSRALKSDPIAPRSIQNTTNQLPWKDKRKQSYSVVTCSDCVPEHKLHVCPKFKKMSNRDKLLRANKFVSNAHSKDITLTRVLPNSNVVSVTRSVTRFFIGHKKTISDYRRRDVVKKTIGLAVMNPSINIYCSAQDPIVFLPPPL